MKCCRIRSLRKIATLRRIFPPPPQHYHHHQVAEITEATETTETSEAGEHKKKSKKGPPTESEGVLIDNGYYLSNQELDRRSLEPDVFCPLCLRNARRALFQCIDSNAEGSEVADSLSAAYKTLDDIGAKLIDSINIDCFIDIIKKYYEKSIQPQEKHVLDGKHHAGAIWTRRSIYQHYFGDHVNTDSELKTRRKRKINTLLNNLERDCMTSKIDCVNFLRIFKGYLEAVKAERALFDK